MNTYRITKEEQEELKRSNMNDLIRDMLGKLLRSTKMNINDRVGIYTSETNNQGVCVVVDEGTQYEVTIYEADTLDDAWKWANDNIDYIKDGIGI